MLKIRTARAEDAALLNEMGNASYRHHFAHLWHNADELACYLQQEYSLASLQRSLTDYQCCWLIAEAPHPVGFAKYACRQAISPEGPSGTLLHKLYLLPDTTGDATASRYFAPSRREQKRPVNAGCGWKCSPITPLRAAFTNVRGCST